MAVIAAAVVIGASSTDLGGSGFQAVAAEAAKPAVTDKPARRASNSPDNLKKRECDAKWKVHKKDSKATGWKPYFTFMANCM